jgi:hypothetical protein
MITPSFSLTATERVLPKLALDFTTASLDPRVTFTRAGNTATVVNSSGYVTPINADLPRFDYDPVTLACKGLLIEEARTNLAFQSNAFDDTTYWSRSNLASVDPNVSGLVSPEGIQNADKVVENTTASVAHGIGQSFTATGASVTFSFYVKNNGRNIQVYFRDSAFSGTLYGQAIINTGAGTVTSSSDATVAIQQLQNGWLRVSITSTVTIPAGARAVAIRLVSGASTVTYTGDGVSGVYLYGAQVELGAFATSYIPTEASQVTRSADVATMTGTNFSDWFNAAEGGFQAQFQDFATGSVFPNYLLISDNTALNRQILFRAGTTTSVRYQIDTLGISQMQQTATITSTANVNNGVLAYKANNCAFSVNAGSVLSDASVTLPTVNRLDIGVSLNGYMRKIFYWPQRLTNAELQAFSK